MLEKAVPHEGPKTPITLWRHRASSHDPMGEPKANTSCVFVSTIGALFKTSQEGKVLGRVGLKLLGFVAPPSPSPQSLSSNGKDGT